MQKNSHKTQADFDNYVVAVEAYFDAIVEQGSDQELFISSYLQGHFAVAVGQCQVAGTSELDVLTALMAKSLGEAFADKELVEEDQKQVDMLWAHFLAKQIG